MTDTTTPDQQPFVMAVRLHIRPEFRAEYRAALAKGIDKARAEPTCHYLYVYESADDPDTIVLVESWADKTTLWEEIFTKDHYQEYLKATEPMYAAPREIEFLTPLHDSDTPRP